MELLGGLSNVFDRVVLYGGLNDVSQGFSQNATYFWNPAAAPNGWTLTSFTISTGPHSSTRTTYDPALLTPSNTDGNVVLFGGYNCDGAGYCPITDGSTWFLDGATTWASCPCSTGNPDQRASEGLTTDFALGTSSPVVVLFGGDTSCERSRIVQ